MMTFPDTHAHLDDRRFKADLNDALIRASERGVKPIITVGSSINSSRLAVQLARSHDSVYSVVGIHPHNASSIDRTVLSELKLLAAEAKVVAIGETGLDYYRDLSPRPVQKDGFRAQLALASTLGMPVVVHDRDAHDDVMSILEQEVDNQTVIMHCFSGDMNLLKECVARNYYISFAGPITFTNNHHSRQAAAIVPLNLLLCETDCPYLTPHPFRGKRNEPAYVVEVATVLAGVHGLSLQEMASHLTANTERAFNLKNCSRQ